METSRRVHEVDQTCKEPAPTALLLLVMSQRNCLKVKMCSALLCRKCRIFVDVVEIKRGRERKLETALICVDTRIKKRLAIISRKTKTTKSEQKRTKSVRSTSRRPSIIPFPHPTQHFAFVSKRKRLRSSFLTFFNPPHLLLFLLPLPLLLTRCRRCRTTFARSSAFS